jgi:hypothetical protein
MAIVRVESVVGLARRRRGVRVYRAVAALAADGHLLSMRLTTSGTRRARVAAVDVEAAVAVDAAQPVS